MDNTAHAVINLQATQGVLIPYFQKKKKKKKKISVHDSFMLTPIDLVMVSKESSFKELSNGMHFNQVQHIPGMVNVS